jgi:hypothetical protein
VNDEKVRSDEYEAPGLDVLGSVSDLTEGASVGSGEQIASTEPVK